MPLRIESQIFPKTNAERRSFQLNFQQLTHSTPSVKTGRLLHSSSVMDSGFSRVLFASLNLIGNIAVSFRQSSCEIVNHLVHDSIANIIFVLTPKRHFNRCSTTWYILAPISGLFVMASPPDLRHQARLRPAGRLPRQLSCRWRYPSTVGRGCFCRPTSSPAV